MLQILLPLLAGLAGLCLLRFFNIPGGSFMGAVIGAALVRLFYQKAKSPPRRLQLLARVIMGLVIGIPVNRQTLETASGAMIPIALMIVGLIGLSFFSAWLASRISGLDFTTALCGSSPGAASTMVILSDDLGGQSPIVTVLHTLRILLIAILMPIAAGIFQPEAAGQLAGEALAQSVTQASALGYAKPAFLIVCGVPAAYLLRRCKVPAGEIMAGILVAGVCNPLFLHIDKSPPLWQLFSVWILATNMGSQLTREAFRAIRRYLPVCEVLTLLLLTMGFLLGCFLYATTSLDIITSLLGSCPGGMDAMILLAGDMRADAPLVAAMHTIRQILIMFTMPFLIRKLTGTGKKTREAEGER
jgi:membrane AbrB-like protein